MKKVELFAVLFLGIILGAGVVWYYNKQPKLDVKTASENKAILSDKTNDIKPTLDKLEVQFKDFSKGKTYEQLVKDKNYQNWVKQVANLIEKEKKMGNKDVVNYIYYNYTANLVLKYIPSASDLERDLIIQSVRRIDFNTLSDKNYYTQLMKDYVDQKYYKPILTELSGIDVKKLNTDNQYFYKIMLDPQTGIFYRIFKNRYDWNKTGIGFKPEFLENQFVDFLSQRFEQILAKLGYDKAWFKKRVFDYYKIHSLKELAELIKQDYTNIKNTYHISKLGIPTDRFFRMDERRDLFKNGGLENKLYAGLGNQKEAFKQAVKQFRLKMYLLSYLGKEQNLFNDKVRAKFIDAEEGPGVQNLFRVGRYVDEVMKLNLKPQVK